MTVDSFVRNSNTTMLLSQLQQELNQILLGKSQVVDHLLTSILARGHVLFDDLPGLGKTTLAKALAVAIGGKFTRIQCTPDLLPNDVTGFNVLNQKTREFEFRPGPVFADVLLADEINRTTPRTQSAFFEAMAERQVTVDGESMPLRSTFLVLATQNPVESLGAYPLPEAQLDRFTMKLQIGYPNRSSEMDLLARHSKRVEDVLPRAVLSPAVLEQMQLQVCQVASEEPIRTYLIDLAEATRSHSAFALGLSPRGLMQWQRASQARAFLLNRDFVTPDDVQAVAEPVLSVRLASNAGNTKTAIASILDSVAVPTL